MNGREWLDRNVQTNAQLATDVNHAVWTTRLLPLGNYHRIDTSAVPVYRAVLAVERRSLIIIHEHCRLKHGNKKYLSYHVYIDSYAAAVPVGRF